MPPAYTTQQKNAIAQFMSFTSVDRTAAARVLKSHNWDAQAAINTFPTSLPRLGANRSQPTHRHHNGLVATSVEKCWQHNYTGP
ncbi:hypothetical protein SNOG_16072 [Parastagonospora nodorum SN15]|uniref:UBA domain-containing protein n=1 Tax=Phaeosphaeria nodorum (strain SN15 / ATCC MYA-4574 / FGSC 10173) TaxID=321614 RepID=Q0TWZ4_PHANO|nr:hypothetical protein SNOG_16072 [Parastagonospora nodorum SN15]EAT76651.1 hypothetical protein SNOG_16072 [Parastagonospora nodorum SN15]